MTAFRWITRASVAPPSGRFKAPMLSAPGDFPFFADVDILANFFSTTTGQGCLRAAAKERQLGECMLTSDNVKKWNSFRLNSVVEWHLQNGCVRIQVAVQQFRSATGLQLLIAISITNSCARSVNYVSHFKCASQLAIWQIYSSLVFGKGEPHTNHCFSIRGLN